MSKKLDPDIKVPCFVCGTQEPLLTAHEHHRKPRAFGGTDDKDNLIYLCASCHTRLHRVQDFVIAGNSGKGFELCAAIFPQNAKARGDLWTLANEAASSEREVRDAFDLHRTHVAVKLSVDADVWGVLKGAAKDRGVSARTLAAELLRRAVKEL